MRLNYYVVTIYMLSIFILTGCNETIQKFYENAEVKEKYSADKETGVKNGDYKKFYKLAWLEARNTDPLWINTSYKDDKLNGTYKSYYPNGQLNTKTSYKEDKLDGEYEKYDRNGQLRVKTTYKNGKIEGVYHEFYPNGKIELEASFINGYLDGAYKSYYDNGQKMLFAMINNGHLSGAFEAYHKTGKLITKGEYLDNHYLHKNLFTDSRDGQKYPIVKIGSQTWLGLNLNYKDSQSKCASSEIDGYCENYLRTYTRASAMNACPTGWRLPSEEEYKQLFKFIQEGDIMDVLYRFEHPIKDDSNDSASIGDIKPLRESWPNMQGSVVGDIRGIFYSDLYRHSSGKVEFKNHGFLGSRPTPKRGIVPYLLMSGDYVHGYDIFGFSASSIPSSKYSGHGNICEETNVKYWTSSVSKYDRNEYRYAEISGFMNKEKLDSLTIIGYSPGKCLSDSYYEASFEGTYNNVNEKEVRMFVRCIEDGADKIVESNQDSDNALEPKHPVAEEKQNSPTDELLIDSRDGKTYRTVKINKQVWMAENLNYKSAESWCYDNSEDKCNQYGRLYSWNAAQKACPSGWRMASDTEWEIVAENHAPFNIKTAGFRNSKGKFELLGKRADFWTTDDVDDKGKYRYFSVSANAMDKNTYSKKGAMSVRCVMSVNN